MVYSSPYTNIPKGRVVTVVSVNPVNVAMTSNSDLDKFWKLLDERCELCYEALMCRHFALLGTHSDISPIHWQGGCIARLKTGEVIDEYLKDGYSTLSLGYIGIYETVYSLLGISHTTPKGKELAIKIVQFLKNKTIEWKERTGLGFALYGTPSESMCMTFCEKDKKEFGIVKNITDKGYYTNSYHVDVREKINAFEKFEFEADFQKISTGGCISYIEIPNMKVNIDALKSLINYIYHHIQYAEFNTKSDYCQECGFDGEILLDENNEWYCPQCGNRNHNTMNVVRRTCGYLGSNFWNDGKTSEIKQRVMHL